MQTPPTGVPPCPGTNGGNLELKLWISLILDWNDLVPESYEVTWGHWIEVLREPHVDSSNLRRTAYHAASRSVQYREKNRQAWMPCRMWDGGSRAPEGVREIFALVLDMPPGMTLEQIQQILGDLEYVVHSTYDHTPEHPQFRVILPLAKPIDPQRLPALFDYFNQLFGGVLNESYGHQWWRFFYFPSCPPDAVSDHVFVHHPGRLLDADEVLVP